MALLNDNYIKDMRIAINRWKAFKTINGKDEGKIILASKVNEMTIAKERMVSLELENNKLSDENEKLR